MTSIPTTSDPLQPRPLSPEQIARGREAARKLFAGYQITRSPCTVLDPFGGAGTTALIAAKMGLNAVLCEHKPEYVKMAAARLTRDLGMLAQVEVIIP